MYTAPLALEQTGVLRAVALRDGTPVSAVTTATYLIGEATGLPVLSLVTAPAHLWDDETGIYTNAGAGGRVWERPVEMEWLSSEGELGFSVGAGLRIHGWGSRASAKKSFRLYFRGEYGPRELAYPLFGTAAPVRRMTGWCCGQGAATVCWGMGLMPCTCGTNWCGSCTGDGASGSTGRWVSLYLNGEYWGLYNLTERIDEDFLATHFAYDYWDVVRRYGGMKRGLRLWTGLPART